MAYTLIYFGGWNIYLISLVLIKNWTIRETSPLVEYGVYLGVLQIHIALQFIYLILLALINSWRSSGMKFVQLSRQDTRGHMTLISCPSCLPCWKPRSCTNDEPSKIRRPCCGVPRSARHPTLSTQKRSGTCTCIRKWSWLKVNFFPISREKKSFIACKGVCLLLLTFLRENGSEIRFAWSSWNIHWFNYFSYMDFAINERFKYILF